MAQELKSNNSNGFSIINVAVAIGLIGTACIAFSVYNSNLAAAKYHSNGDGDAESTEGNDAFYRVSVDDPLFQPLSNR